jgi:hypothetical protein
VYFVVGQPEDWYVAFGGSRKGARREQEGARKSKEEQGGERSKERGRNEQGSKFLFFFQGPTRLKNLRNIIFNFFSGHTRHNNRSTFKKLNKYLTDEWQARKHSEKIFQLPGLSPKVCKICFQQIIFITLFSFPKFS